MTKKNSGESLRHRDHPDHLHRYRALIDDLTSDRRWGAGRLRAKLIQCNDPSRPGRPKACNSPACPWCRDRHIARERRALERRYADVPNAELALASIVFGVTRDVNDIGLTWTKARKNLQNLLAACRRKSAAWDSVEVQIYLEIDCVDAQDIPLLGSEKQRQLHEMGGFTSDAAGPVWIVTAHGVVATGPDLSIEEITAAFVSKWQKYHQVHLRRFFDWRENQTNINRIVNYSLKREFITELSNKKQRPWDREWVTDFSLWTESFSHGFKSLRTHLRSKRVKSPSRSDGMSGDGVSSQNAMSFITVGDCVSACNFDPLRWGIGVQF